MITVVKLLRHCINIPWQVLAKFTNADIFVYFRDSRSKKETKRG